MKWEKKNPIFGDVIKIENGFLMHFGIYVSDDEVIQFGDLPTYGNLVEADKINVCVTDIKNFDNGTLMVGVLEENELGIAKSPEDTVSMARSRIGEKNYDFSKNNCESFVYQCKLGLSISPLTNEGASDFIKMLKKIKRGKKI